MRLIGPKPKKFWSPSLITQLGGSIPVPTLTATFAQTNLSAGGGPGGTTWTTSFTFPTVATGDVIVAAMFDQGNVVISGITIDPGGLALALTLESGAAGASPCLWDGLVSSGFSGAKNVTVTVANNALQFHFIALTVWVLHGQTVNTPQIVGRSTGNIASLSVTGGQVMVAACGSTGTQTWDYATTTPQIPSTTHGSGTISGVAEWANTQTATYAVTGKFTINPQMGMVAATYK